MKEILAILLLSSVLLLGCVSGDVEKTATPQPTKQAIETSTAKPTVHATVQPTGTPRADPTPEAKIELKIGETADNGEEKVTVSSVNLTDYYRYTDIFGGTQISQPDAGKTWAIAEVEIKNIGESRVYATAADFFVIDDDGNKYDAEWLNQMEDAFESKELIIGTRESGKLLFEVPTNAKGLKLVYDFGNIFEKAKLAIWKIEKEANS